MLREKKIWNEIHLVYIWHMLITIETIVCLMYHLLIYITSIPNSLPFPHFIFHNYIHWVKKHRHTKLQKKVPKECIFSMGGGTMRNSRGEIDILVLCKAISLKTLYDYSYHHEKISWWRTSLTLCFQCNTECKW